MLTYLISPVAVVVVAKVRWGVEKPKGKEDAVAFVILEFCHELHSGDFLVFEFHEVIGFLVV